MKLCESFKVYIPDLSNRFNHILIGVKQMNGYENFSEEKNIFFMIINAHHMIFNEESTMNKTILPFFDKIIFCLNKRKIAYT